MKKKSEKALVICEDWPSWLFVLPGLGFTHLHVTYERLPSENIREALHTIYEFEEDVESETETRLLGDVDDTVFFLTGEESFVRQKLRKLPDKAKVWVAISGRARRHPAFGDDFRWTQVKHSDSGGGTGSRAWIGQNAFQWLDYPPEHDANRRSVKDVLSTIECGRTADPPERWTKGEIILPTDLFPVQGDLATVLAPSVFSATRWVARSLTNKELAALFDVPVKLQCLDWTDTGLPFLTAVPSKILWACTSRIRSDEEEPNPAVGISESPQAVKQESKGSSMNTPHPESAPELIGEIDWSQTVASKADDAATDTLMWDLRASATLKIRDAEHFKRARRALDLLRAACHRWWVRRIRKEIMQYLEDRYGKDWMKPERPFRRSKGCMRELEVLSECYYRSACSNWWDWSSGSTLYYWRWTKDFQHEAREGVAIFQVDKGPRWTTPQRRESDEAKLVMVREKLQKVLDRGYVSAGKVLSLTSYFWVDKAKGTDIRMVYDGTKSGLNASIWTPNFFVPSIDSLVDLVDSNSWLSDIDLGEMFLNFPLDSKIQSLAGIDLTPYFPLDSGRSNWKRWTRCLMGVKSSPYNAVGSLRWAEEMIRENLQDADNPFQWDKVELNLPGDDSYDPRRPWVSKRRLDGCISNDFVDYIDDIRPTGNGLTPEEAEEEAYRTTRRIASVFNYLGIQDAPRKRRPPSQSPGAWNGCLIETGKDGVFLKVSQERWDKTKMLIRSIHEELNTKGRLAFKQLRSYRGYLVYVARTYGFLVPYLKGIHLTLESWRPRRDREGWGIRGANPNECDETFMFDECVFLSDDGEFGAPNSVKPVPRLAFDLASLIQLTSGELPPKVRIRPAEVLWIVYGAGDASGTGLGSAFSYSAGLSSRMGLWGSDMDDSSSNFRELYNLVDSVDKECLSGQLHDAEVFLFTDNSTAESAFYRGTSSNKRLFELVLRLRKVEMQYGLKIHMIHIPGTRMIDIGVDGLSRGNTFEGVMSDPSSFLDYVPLNKGVHQRSSSIVSWFSSIFSQEDAPVVEHLSPEGWFERGHDIDGWSRSWSEPRVPGGKRRPTSPWIPSIRPGTFLWTPPPTAARQALEQLRKARHRRQLSTHIVAIPRLFTSHWRRQLFKVADLVFEIPVLEPYRSGVRISTNQLLWVSYFLFFLTGLGNARTLQDFWHCRGNCVHCGRKIHPTQGIFCANFGLSRGGLPPCREAWCGVCYKPHRLDSFHVEEPTDQDGFVWVKRGDENRFRVARNGDSFLTHFEGDGCVFFNLTGKLFPGERGASFSDDMLMCCIRRMNLDAFWSRERGTVNATRRGVESCLEHAETVGIRNLFPTFGPMPLHKDVKGYGAAVCMLLESMKPGKYHSTHQQFDTIRKLRSSFRNVWGASWEETTTEYYLGYEDKRRQTISSCPTLSDWFGRFAMGCKKRMGQDVRPQLAISIEVMVALEALLEVKWRACRNQSDRSLVATVGAYCVMCFCCSLRGNEGFLLDLAGLRSHIDKGRLHPHPHVTAPLLGRFKGEEGEKYHLLFMVSNTNSGIPCRKWMERLVDQRAREGHFRGPAFVGEDGMVVGSGIVETFVLDCLEEIQVSKPDVIDPDVAVFEVYGISRSFRRGATTHARNMGVSESDIDVVNRWRKFEEAKGKRPNLPMRDHYSQKVQMITTLLRFSKAL